MTANSPVFGTDTLIKKVAGQNLECMIQNGKGILQLKGFLAISYFIC